MRMRSRREAQVVVSPPLSTKSESSCPILRSRGRRRRQRRGRIQAPCVRERDVSSCQSASARCFESASILSHATLCTHPEIGSPHNSTALCRPTSLALDYSIQNLFSPSIGPSAAHSELLCIVLLLAQIDWPTSFGCASRRLCCTPLARREGRRRLKELRGVGALHGRLIDDALDAATAAAVAIARALAIVADVAPMGWKRMKGRKARKQSRRRRSLFASSPSPTLDLVASLRRRSSQRRRRRTTMMTIRRHRRHGHQSAARRCQRRRRRWSLPRQGRRRQDDL